MDNYEFQQLIERKYAQVVLKILLDGDESVHSFTAIRKEVDAIVTDGSRGAEETCVEGDYSTGTLNSVLSAAKEAGIVTKYYDEDDQPWWCLCRSELTTAQINEIRYRNHPGMVHTDTHHMDHYESNHTIVLS